jgi:hypothetical protein
MKDAPIDEQRSLVRLLESVATKPKPTRRFFLGPAYAIAAILIGTIGLGGYWSNRTKNEPTLVSRDITPGKWLVTKDQKVPLTFSEGSQVLVAESSRVRVSSVDPKGAVVVVEGGSVRAQITHRKDTRWAFAAGPFNVRVTGTVLRVTWRPEKQVFELGVDEGSVIAHGPFLGNGRVLTQGENCVVQIATSQVNCSGKSQSAPVETTQTTPPKPNPSESIDVTQLPLVDDLNELDDRTLERAVIPSAPDFSRVRELEKAGKFAEALDVAKHQGLERLLQSGGSEALFCLSRLGRYQGNASLARGALIKIRDRFGKTKEAANAAFLLGRQAAPAEAAQWFSTYLIEQPRGTFAREAAGRLIESYQRAGQFTQAQSAAKRYLNEYPTGPHAGFAKSLLSNP